MSRRVRLAIRRLVIGPMTVGLALAAGGCGRSSNHEGAAHPADTGTSGPQRRALPSQPAAASTSDSAAGTAIGAATQSAPESLPRGFGFGRPATSKEIAMVDIDVRPDGKGLPAGRGTVAEGARVYAARCAKCHGKTGTEGPADLLVGREPGEGFLFGQFTSLHRTIGNYWPYATTLYDYINRAMPLDAPGSLKPDEIYGIVAYLLFRNDIVPGTALMDPKTLPAVRMPAAGHFVPDDRKGGAEVK